MTPAFSRLAGVERQGFENKRPAKIFEPTKPPFEPN